MIAGTYIGIDLGERRIGLARSDPTGLIASPYKTLTVSSMSEAARLIAREIEETGAVGAVIGYPLSLNGGNRGERCRMVDGFLEHFQRLYKGPVHKVDERFSSAEAEQTVHSHGKKIGRDKGRVDRIAAAIILQRFLDEN